MSLLHQARIGLCFEFHATSPRSIPTTISESDWTHNFWTPLSLASLRPRRRAFNSAFMEVQMPIFSTKPDIHSPLCPLRTPPPPAVPGLPLAAPSVLSTTQLGEGASQWTPISAQFVWHLLHPYFVIKCLENLYKTSEKETNLSTWIFSGVSKQKFDS